LHLSPAGQSPRQAGNGPVHGINAVLVVVLLVVVRVVVVCGGRVLVEHVLGNRAEVLHVAIVRGERPLHRRQPGSRTGAGILHAWYMTIARKTRSKSWNPAEAMRKK